MDLDQTSALERLPDSISEVWLFGSHARGTSLASSDIDLLVVGDVQAEAHPSLVQEALGLHSQPDVSFYTRGGIKRICEPASIFSWHLRLEALPLVCRVPWLSSCLGKLAPYTRHAEDVEINQELILDAIHSLSESATSCILDAGILATASRNITLVLSHFDGMPDFDPLSPLRARDHHSAPYPLDDRSFMYLRACRVAAERGADIPVGRGLQDLLDLGNSVLTWSRRVKEYVVS
jgi:hypothetical protein